jgi:hypothetical protein
MNDSGLIRPAIELRRNGIAVATYPLDAGRLSIGRSPSSESGWRTTASPGVTPRSSGGLMAHSS